MHLRSEPKSVKVKLKRDKHTFAATITGPVWAKNKELPCSSILVSHWNVIFAAIDTFEEDNGTSLESLHSA